MTTRQSSIDRVAQAARSLSLEIEIRRMAQSTRTAEEAAAACGCAVDQIVKSLIFAGESSGEFRLLLVAGGNRVDMAKIADVVGEGLTRADPRKVRDKTGFAIGGVAPIGHLAPIDCYMDQRLLEFDTVWAAAGRPDSVFQVNARALAEATEATLFIA